MMLLVMEMVCTQEQTKVHANGTGNSSFKIVFLLMKDLKVDLYTQLKCWHQTEPTLEEIQEQG